MFRYSSLFIYSPIQQYPARIFKVPTTRKALCLCGEKKTNEKQSPGQSWWDAACKQIRLCDYLEREGALTKGVRKGIQQETAEI